MNRVELVTLDTVEKIMVEQAACLEFMGRAAGTTTVAEWLTERGRPDLIPGVNPLF